MGEEKMSYVKNNICKMIMILLTILYCIGGHCIVDAEDVNVINMNGCERVVSPRANATVSKITLNKSNITLNTNSSTTLKAAVIGKSKQVTWKSTNNKIVTVNSKGKVTAKKAGTVTITAKANGITAKCKVTVKKSSTSSAAKYRQFLNASGVRYYCILELGSSKKTVLLTTNTLYDPYWSGKPTANECSVYTIENNQVSYLGRLTCRASFCIMYDKNYLYSLRTQYIEQYRIVGDTMKYKIVSYDLYDDIKNVNFKKNEFVRR